MAFYSEWKKTKDGKRYSEIRVSRGRGRSPYQTRWYWPEGWSRKTAERELGKAAAEFERACAAGEVKNREEERAKAAAEAAEAAKLKTVKQYAQGVFMAAKEVTFSENARASYQMFLNKHIYPAIGDMLMVDVTPAIISKILLDFQKAGHAHASAVKLYNILNGIFKMAYLDDSISVDPMLKVKRPAPRKDETAPEEAEKAYTAQEMNYILSCAAQEPLKWHVYITLAADTWARRGELCGLQWQDIDWTAGALTIRRNLQYTPHKGVYETSPKNGKARVVDIGPDTLVLLRKLRNEQSSMCLSRYVFTQDGTPDPIHPDSPTRYFKKFGERYGIEDFHPHKLRHTGASVGITSGADVVSVSQRLGHSDTAVTLRMYAHANEESIRRAGQILRDAIKAAAK